MNQLPVNVVDTGIAVFLVAIVVWFLIFKFWPWYTQRVAIADTEKKTLHTEYLQTIKEFSTAINAASVTNAKLAEAIFLLKGNVDAQHAEVMKLLTDIEMWVTK